jgi:ABC-type transport system involved in cytochrome c biogenesis ATPase subunit
VADAISGHVQRGGMALFTSHQPMDLQGRGASYRLNA